MLIIRKEQMAVFSRKALESFERRMADLLRKEFPEKCNEMGPEALSRSIQKGLQQAEKHAFRTEFDVARYIGLMVLLGEDFSETNQFPWVRAILARNNLTATAKLDMLCLQAENERNVRGETIAKE